MIRPRRLRLFTLALCMSGLAACSGGDVPPRHLPTTTRTPSASPPPTEPTPAPRSVWLCRPGPADNPCEDDLVTTVVSADRRRTREPVRSAQTPAFDCFYVYPTVSGAPRTTAPRRVTPALRQVARAQAALFSRECRVYAPVYRQVTMQGLLTGGFTDARARARAHGDVVSAWHEYLARWNNGRPFLLLGHSQGAFELTTLIADEVDDDPALRERMVSAMLLGGAVTVARGDSGGSFDNVPACVSTVQSGCVVAYNTYARTPPKPSVFGRAGAGEQVLCVNPAAPAGGVAALTPYVPERSPGGRVIGFTAYQDAVAARCRGGNGASWLHVRPDRALPSELTTATPSAAWGLHRADVNIALGDLVDLAARQAAAMP